MKGLSVYQSYLPVSQIIKGKIKKIQLLNQGCSASHPDASNSPYHLLSQQAGDFSSFQLVGVLKRGKMNQRLDELRRDMNSKNSGDLAGVAPDDSLGENSAVKSQKILSEDSAHYILLKNNGQAAEKDQHESGKD